MSFFQKGRPVTKLWGAKCMNTLLNMFPKFSALIGEAFMSLDALSKEQIVIQIKKASFSGNIRVFVSRLNKTTHILLDPLLKVNKDFLKIPEEFLFR